MAEHTCAVAWYTPPCPGCQERLRDIVAAEAAILDIVRANARAEYPPFLEEWKPLFDLGKTLNRLRGELPAPAATAVPALHLYEFEEAGYYAAPSKEEAILLCGYDLGDDDLAAAEALFVRAYRDDELVAVYGEGPDDKWDDPREIRRELTRKGQPTGEFRWVLEVTAQEWANKLTHGRGHVFGGQD